MFIRAKGDAREEHRVREARPGHRGAPSHRGRREVRGRRRRQVTDRGGPALVLDEPGQWLWNSLDQSAPIDDRFEIKHSLIAVDLLCFIHDFGK